MENVALLIERLYGGGAERVVANLSRELSKKYKVYIFLIDTSIIEYEYEGTIVDLGYKPPQKTKGVFRSCLAFFNKIRVVKKAKKMYSIDCTISHLTKNNLINIFSKREDKIISCIHIMLSKVKSPNVLNKFIHKFIAKFSYRYITVSKQSMMDLIETFGVDEKKMQTIYNYVHLDMISKLSSSKNDLCEVKFSKNTITNIGRLTEQKGQWHLIRAFSIVKQQVPDAKLIIMGTGHLLEKLKELVKKLGLIDSVEFLGFISNPFSVLKQSKVFALSSNFEGLPMVLLEAMACGIPLVSTDCDSGAREILAPDTDIFKKTSELEFAKYGILTPVCSGDEITTTVSEEERKFAQAIINLLVDQELYDSYKTKSKYGVNQFTPEEISSQWINLIDE